MVVSILTRKTRIRDRAQWETALATVLPKIRELLASERGFASVEYAWGVDGGGEFAQLTTWKTLADCQNFVRGGGAATVATIEDAAVPTAPHPDGAWVRKTFETIP